MMGEYYRASKDKRLVESFYDTFIEPAAAFLTKFIDESTGLPHASYDLWEQKFQTSTYTVCTVIAALDSANMLATVCNRPDDASRWKRAAEAMRGLKIDSPFGTDGTVTMRDRDSATQTRIALTDVSAFIAEKLGVPVGGSGSLFDQRYRAELRRLAMSDGLP